MSNTVLENKQKYLVIICFSIFSQGDGKNIDTEFITTENRRKVLSRRMSDYISSFSVHGLTKIVKGTKLERCVWLIFLVMALTAAVVVIKGYIDGYLRHDVNHDFSNVFERKAYFPSITFCLPRFKTALSKSYKPNCTVPKRTMFLESGKKIITNGIFNILDCKVGGSENCTKDMFQWDDNLKGICFTWFPERKYYQAGEPAFIEFYVAYDLLYGQQVSVTVHDQAFHSVLLSPDILIRAGLRSWIKLQKTVSKRLPYPFPSNCTNKTLYYEFPGHYNRRSCLLHHRDIDLYKKYGFLSDISRNYIPKDLMTNKNASGNINTDDFIKTNNYIDYGNTDCPLACYEVSFDVTHSLRHLEEKIYLPNYGIDAEIEDVPPNSCFNVVPYRFKRFQYFTAKISYKSPEFYYLMEEKEAYSWQNMLAEFGGFLGLMIGASALSLVEICTYLTMAVLKKLS